MAVGRQQRTRWLLRGLQPREVYVSDHRWACVQVLPEPALPHGRWPQNLVVGYAAGYTYEVRPTVA